MASEVGTAVFDRAAIRDIRLYTETGRELNRTGHRRQNPLFCQSQRSPVFFF